MTLIGRQSEQDKIRICKALLHCLKSLHHAGIVHADIKLDNVIFRKLPSGKITGKLIDFDNSFWESQPPAPDEEILGDPVYMAPETFLMRKKRKAGLRVQSMYLHWGWYFTRFLQENFLSLIMKSMTMLLKQY